ncbi:MAG: alpha-galactosidase [Eubacterium sp.]
MKPVSIIIIIAAIIAVLLVCFFAWFFTLKVNGICPICAMKKLFFPTKLTIDTENDPDYDNGAALTPPMGWSTWNTFRNNIDQDLVLESARAMKDSGLADAGYQYINLDDCWQSSLRDSDGKLQGDLKRFSRGIPALIKDINELGLKVGLYSSNGTLTCEDFPASLGNEELDAKTMASWGCEFFKYDFCHHQKINGSCPAIASIEINRLEDDNVIYLNPEDAEFEGRAKIINISELPDKKAIGYIGYGAGTALFKRNIEEAGKYALTVVYHKTLSRKKKYMQIVINGRIYEIFFPETNSFSPTGREQIIVELSEGENTFLLKNPVITLADSSYVQYKRMGDALKRASHQWAQITKTEEKPIVYSICEWGTAFPWNWGRKAGNMWRTTHDIMAKWTSIVLLYKYTMKQYEHAGPGAWNDPDMLEVGNGKLTENENQAHFSLWCMMAAPLMLGNDIRQFVDGGNAPVNANSTLKIVTNKQLIAIDQDTLGKPAKILKKSNGIDILARPLSNGDVALCIFNHGLSAKSVNFNLDNLADDEYLSFAPAQQYELHNLWSDERTTAKTLSASVEKHSVKVYRVKAL